MYFVILIVCLITYCHKKTPQRYCFFFNCANLLTIISKKNALLYVVLYVFGLCSSQYRANYESDTSQSRILPHPIYTTYISRDFKNTKKTATEVTVSCLLIEEPNYFLSNACLLNAGIAFAARTTLFGAPSVNSSVG